jgi:hypothetical protein
MPFTRGDRVIVVCVFIGALVETYAAILVLDGTHRSGRYSFWSSGFAGRYMLPYCLAGLLALKQNWKVLTSRIAERSCASHVRDVRAAVPGDGRQILLSVTAAVLSECDPAHEGACATGATRRCHLAELGRIERQIGRVVELHVVADVARVHAQLASLTDGS